MRKTKSVEWTCELEGCNNKFKRYPSQIKKSIKRFCSQECSAYGTYDNRIATLKIKNSKNNDIFIICFIEKIRIYNNN